MALQSVKAQPWEQLTFVKGEPIELRECIGKHVVILEFWATWCPPCRDSIPHLSEIATKYRNEGVIALGISTEDKGKVIPFVQKMGEKMDYLVACDPSSQTTSWYSQQFSMQGIPAAVVIDHEGTVRWHGHPMDGGLIKALDECVQLLKKADKSHPAVSAKGKSRQELSAMKVHDLHALLAEYNVDYSAIFEKSELVDAVIAHRGEHQ